MILRTLLGLTFKNLFVFIRLGRLVSLWEVLLKSLHVVIHVLCAALTHFSLLERRGDPTSAVVGRVAQVLVRKFLVFSSFVSSEAPVLRWKHVV